MKDLDPAHRLAEFRESTVRLEGSRHLKVITVGNQYAVEGGEADKGSVGPAVPRGEKVLQQVQLNTPKLPDQT